MMMLDRLHRTHRTRSVTALVAAVAIGAVVLVGGGVLVAHRDTAGQVTPPVSTTPTPDPRCSEATITCLGGNRFRLALTVPVTVAVPINFAGDFTEFGADVFEDYRTDLGSTGVTVFENATPVKNDASWTRDPAAGTTAHSVATWLSARPFLVHATITPTTVGGRQAWRVSADLKPGAKLPADKDGQQAAPTFTSGTATAGYSDVLTCDYTFLDVPGAGVTVIWSWTEHNDKGALTDNHTFVDGLSFG